MADTYNNFKSLLAIEKKDVDFKIFAKNIGSRIAIVAPHGGGIEPGGIMGTSMLLCFR